MGLCLRGSPPLPLGRNATFAPLHAVWHFSEEFALLEDGGQGVPGSIGEELQLRGRPAIDARSFSARHGMEGSPEISTSQGGKAPPWLP